MLFKAGSALAGGVVGHGETCGALTGCIIAIGSVVGRARLEDLEAFQRAKIPAQEMYQRFRDEIGDSLCANIHKIKFGRWYDLANPAEVKAFHKAGGHDRAGCPEVCGKAARIAADIILELREEA